MKIIVTRPSPDGEAIARDIAGLGAEPILSPAMVIRKRAIAIDLSGAGALAFTSANGVRAFAALSTARELPVFAIGEATAAAARAAGFHEVETAGGDVGSLAGLIAASKPLLQILHFAGSERAGDLVATLAANGVAARRAVVYDAEKTAGISPSARRALEGEPENVAVLFYSARSARFFLEQIEAAGLTPLLAAATALAFSAEIADAAGRARWGAIKIADSRRAGAMADLVQREISGRRVSKTPPR